MFSPLSIVTLALRIKASLLRPPVVSIIVPAGIPVPVTVWPFSNSPWITCTLTALLATTLLVTIPTVLPIAPGEDASTIVPS